MATNREDDALLALHRRLLDGDRVASEEAARLLLVPLMEETRQQYPRLDEQLIADAVVDALLDYFSEPSRAESRGQSGPRAFLRKAAWRNAANVYRSTKRRKVREQTWMTRTHNPHVEDASALGTLIQQEESQARNRQLAELMALLPDKLDREVLRLRLQGERRVEVFAAVLGISQLSASEQRRIVKQTKDRIDKVIKRGRKGRK